MSRVLSSLAAVDPAGLKPCASILAAIALIASPVRAQTGAVEAQTGAVESAVAGGIVVNGTAIQIGPNGQPARDAQPPATGHSTIRGRVVSTDGQAVRRATVRINAPELRGTRTSLTDADGRYEFRDLPAGRYSINVSKTAFVNWAYGQTQAASPAKPLVLLENQAADGIDVRLPRGAVITGRITDDFGDPIAGVNVSLMRQQFVQGQRRLAPGGRNAQTDDIGEYRIFGLAPGQYYLSATPTQNGPAGPFNNVVEGPEARNGFAPTFYPGTTDIGAAQRITVGLSQTVSDINIALLPTHLATVSGVAVDSQGRAMTAGFVSLIRRGGTTGLGGGSGGQLRPDGTFTIPNVAPGDYIARANTMTIRPQGGAAVAPPVPAEVSTAVLTVNGDDVTGVRLTPMIPMTIAGRVSFDDPGAAQTIKPSSIRIIAQSLNADDNVIGLGTPGGPPTVQDDLTFEVKVTSARVALRTAIQAAPGTPATWQLKAIRLNGADVTDSGIEPGSQGTRGVEIELTNRLQQIAGGVTDGRNNAVKEYVVVVFAQDTTQRNAPFNRYFATGRPGDDGRFKINTLPPGRYYAIALDKADATQWQDPEFLDGLTRQATPFSVAEAAIVTLDLRLFAVQ